jgi:hypothetical protein
LIDGCTQPAEKGAMAPSIISLTAVAARKPLGPLDHGQPTHAVLHLIDGRAGCGVGRGGAGAEQCRRGERRCGETRCVAAGGAVVIGWLAAHQHGMM